MKTKRKEHGKVDSSDLYSAQGYLTCTVDVH
jgi:hypothetical protein